MSLLFYNLCYIRVKRLFSLLYNHVQQHILNAYFLLLMVDQNINQQWFYLHLLFSILFIELQEQNYPYTVILPGIYVALFWSEN